MLRSAMTPFGRVWNDARPIPDDARPVPMPSAPSTRMPRPGGHSLKRALLAGIGRVLAERDALNRINVFPVPDGDTGSNLGFTLRAVREALARRRSAHAGRVLRHVADEAIDGARGNSGAILAQFLQGVSEVLDGHDRIGTQTLALAAERGAGQATLAIAEPRAGTMLSVIDAFARALRQAGHDDVRVAFARALAASREALADTPRQLEVLRRAGVVDAGARGFVELLEGIHDYIERGRAALDRAEAGDAAEAGVIVAVEDGCDPQRWCSECVLSAPAIDRAAVRAALDDLGGSSLVMAGTREKLRIHLHVDDPQRLFDTLARFGEVRARKADDMHAQQRARTPGARVAVVVDSAADLPDHALERLPLHLVPVRVSIGARDHLDKVSLSPAELHAALRDGREAVRTSQPPPGDFRRLFEFLLSHHDDVLYVGLSAALSGTLQSGLAAATACGARVHVFDTRTASGGQGLLARHAAERAAAGLDVGAIVAELERLRARTRTFAYVRDLAPAVRGGRVPRWALPITRRFGLIPLIRAIGDGDGRLHLAGALRDRAGLEARFVARAVSRLDRSCRWRAQVLHCDNRAEAERVRAALRAVLPGLADEDVIEAGSGIGAHAGPGAVVLALMPAEA